MGSVEEVGETLCHVDFPLYSLSVLSPRHLILAGGGGAAKTGVKNGFEILELSHDGSRSTAESITRYITDEFSVMNMDSDNYDKGSNLIVCGHNDKSQIYKLSLTRSEESSADITPETPNSKDGLRQRHQNKNGSIPGGNNNDVTKLIFDVEKMKSVQTDYNMPEPYQKVVKISPNGKFMATGGDDGLLRIWTFPDANQTHEIEAHSKEIDDLDFSPDSNKVISVSKDGHGLVWDVKKGKKHAEIGWEIDIQAYKKIKYNYKRIRYGKVENDVKKSKLFAIVNPVGSSKPPSYLQRWDTKAYVLEQKVPHQGSLSALAVSDNGHFVATGSMFDGTVDIYTAFNLVRLKRVEKAHSTFITGLEFLPTCDESAPMRGFSDASVVSISVDHKVGIHHIPRQTQVSMTVAVIIIILFLFGVFVLCSFLGL